MLSFDAVHALTTCLLHVQHDPPTASDPNDLLGTVVLAQDQPVGPTGARLRHLRALQLPMHGDHGRLHNLPAALHHIADALTAHDRSRTAQRPIADHGRDGIDVDILRAALRQPGLRLIAWAVCYDDLLAQDAGLALVRRVDAVDVDGRVYQLSLCPGDTHPALVIDEQADPDDVPATYPPLARLVTATQQT